MDDIERLRKLRDKIEKIEARGDVELRHSLLGRRYLRLRNGEGIDAAESGYWGEHGWQVLLSVFLITALTYFVASTLFS